ncbi:MAG TPA: Lrp/AsnC family transcriptional regulator [Pseudomonadales bacterium]|nr:Lrp/AsnC family transcriptional regulator [Pseudomonadales bacterium]
MNLDDLDHRLIALLRTNARLPVADLARQLGVARATVQNRMQRLERADVIRGYTVTLVTGDDGVGVRAMMSLAVESRAEQDVIQTLRGRTEIAAIHHTTGQWDLILELESRNLAEFNTAVGQIRQIEGVRATESNILLDSLHRRS